MPRYPEHKSSYGIITVLHAESFREGKTRIGIRLFGIGRQITPRRVHKPHSKYAHPQGHKKSIGDDAASMAELPNC